MLMTMRRNVLYLTVVLILSGCWCQCNGFLAVVAGDSRQPPQRHRSKRVQKHQQRFYQRLERKRQGRYIATRRFATSDSHNHDARRNRDNDNKKQTLSSFWNNRRNRPRGGATEPHPTELHMLSSPEQPQPFSQQQPKPSPLTQLQVLSSSEEKLDEEVLQDEKEQEQDHNEPETETHILAAAAAATTTLETTNGLTENDQKALILGVAGVSLVLTTVLGKFGMLPASPLLVSASTSAAVPYTDAYLLRDVGLTILTGGLGYAVAKITTWAFEQDYISSKDARKIIHTISAPAFMLFWPFFSPAQGSFCFCALVPLINALRLYLASTGNGESSLARAISRTGNLQEALGGPFIYVCIVAAAILGFWRDSSAGVVALCTMAIGDGLADLLGRRFGKSNPWPGMQKSVAGSAAFWIGSTLAIVGILQWMQAFGWMTAFAVDLTTADLWIRAAAIGFLTAALELVPIGDDNYTVPLTGAILGALLFPVVS